MSEVIHPSILALLFRGPKHLEKRAKAHKDNANALREFANSLIPWSTFNGNEQNGYTVTIREARSDAPVTAYSDRSDLGVVASHHDLAAEAYQKAANFKSRR